MTSSTLSRFVGRNLKLFFKDKGMFFSSLITPVILLVLYATFLAKIYRDSFVSALPPGMTVPDSLIDGTVVCQLASSLLAVCCVTVSFCANLIMIGDKASGVIRDFTVSPIGRGTMALGYFISAFLSALIISFTALGASFIYLAIMGWYLSLTDVLLVIGDVVWLTLFGTSVSSCINVFLTTAGQASAVGTIISAGYGFICGAYMPIANFAKGLQNVLMCLPGTYGTSLIRNRMMRGVFEEMESFGFPPEVMTGIRDGIDCNIYFFNVETPVPIWAMLAVLIGSVVLCTAAFVLIVRLRRNRA